MVRFGLSLAKQKGISLSQPALAVNNLKTGYPSDRHVISNISFNVAAGERVAVIGANGAGKSTLFKAIVGLLPIIAGHISIYGEDGHSRHSQVGYVPQQNDIDWSFPVSVLDVVMMGRSRHIGWFRLPGKKDGAVVRRILDHLSLNDFAARQISELSGGQRRRVFIARALAQEARVLLLDEPFTGVDRASEREITETLDSLTRQGITVLLSTHHMEKASQRFDKTIILKNGTLLDFGKPHIVLSSKNLVTAFSDCCAGVSAQRQAADI